MSSRYDVFTARYVIKSWICYIKLSRMYAFHHLRFIIKVVLNKIRVFDMRLWIHIINYHTKIHVGNPHNVVHCFPQIIGYHIINNYVEGKWRYLCFLQNY